MGRPKKEPQEWTEGQARARAARARVAGQLAALVLERDATGSRDAFALRLTQLAAAQRDGDAEAVRAAVMEVSISAAQWVVSLDLRQSA